MHCSDFLFTSERLGFRPWQDDDIDDLHTINSDPQVMRYFPNTLEREQTVAFIDRMKLMYHDHGYCYFAVEELQNKGVIGFIGIAYQDYPAPFTPGVDIGWRLHPDHWGIGYATEGGQRCLEFAFNTIGLDAVWSVAPTANFLSIQVMKRLGLHPAGTFVHPNLKDHPELALCTLYKMDRKSYLKGTVQSI